jgi:membrane protein
MIHKKIIASSLKLKPVNGFINFTKNISLPGFDHIPVFDVILFFGRAIKNGAITTRASSLAFNFFLAIFPGLIFLFTLIPYIPIDSFQEELFRLLKEILPYNAFEATQSTILDIINQPRGGLLSFGFGVTIYFATNGIMAMIKGFNNSYYDIETRSPVMQRIVAFILVIILTLLLMIAVTLIISSSAILNYLVLKGFISDSLTLILLELGKWSIILGLLFFCFSFLYYFAPNKKSKFRFISAGSTLATLLSILTSLGFAFYVNNFGTYNKLYGSIGTLMVILLWIHFNSIILLAGFELNASIDNAKKNNS